MEAHCIVGGDPRRPAGSRWVELRVRRGNVCSGPVGSLSTLDRLLKWLVRIPGVPGRIRSLGLASISQSVLGRNASGIVPTGLLIGRIRNPPHGREHRLEVEMTVKLIDEDLS